MRSVLITGANGFLGSYASAYCAAQGFEVIGLSRSAPQCKRSFTEYLVGSLECVDLEKLFAQHPLDLCLHFASASSVSASVSSPVDDFMDSLPGAVRLFDCVRRIRPECHVILASSAAVYGNPDTVPVGENAPLKPISPYGVHKCLLESLANQYCRLYKLNATAMRVFSAYGIGLRKQLLWDACRKGLSSLSRGEKEVEFFGTGLETRDFIHAADVASAAICLHRAKQPGFSVCNVASGVEISIAEILNLILKALGSGLRARFTGIERPGDPKRWCADTTYLKHAGFGVTADLHDEIPRYVAWAAEVNKLTNHP